METKYYTPDISEFHVGFEYEWKNIWGDWNKCMERDYGDSFKERETRVKYLDKEDIESLGFSFNTIMTSSYNLEKEESQEDNIEEYLGYFEKDLDVVLSYRPETHYLTIRSTYGSYDISLFKGYIKNKNELKVLLKQLGINE